MNRISILLILALFPYGHAVADSAIAPFKADYATFRNGKEMAKSTIEYSRNADASWTLRTTTEGTSGLAQMAGLDVSEESVISWVDGRPQTIRYDFHQDVAFKKKQRHGNFDWNAMEVHMVDGKSDEHYALMPYAIDRHALTLAIAADLSRGATSFDYKVATRDKIDDVSYTRCADTRLLVPAGSFDTRCLQRLRKKRTSTSWFAKSLGWIPIQIEQVEAKGDTVTLKLVSLESGIGNRE